MQDFFPQMAMKPNPQCEESYCRKRQQEYQVSFLLEMLFRGEATIPIQGKNTQACSVKYVQPGSCSSEISFKF